jgi:hypothetical protein
MEVSQQSFSVLKGRFVSGNTLIQGLTTYDPLNLLIKKTAITGFIAQLDSADAAVTLTEEAFKTQTSNRMKLSFREAEAADENCLENRIRNIRDYIGVDLGTDRGAYKMISGFLQKIKPRYPKKPEGAPRGAGRSPSEQSYVALNGYATQTLKMIEALDTDYAPQNTYIQYANFKTFVEDMLELTDNIAAAQDAYKTAVGIRKALYLGKEGLKKRQSLIKKYLSSFSGGKKNQNYMNYDSLIKGN